MEFPILLKVGGAQAAKAAAGELAGLRTQIGGAQTAATQLGETRATPADLRRLAGESADARAELGRLLTQKRALETGPAVDIGLGRELEGRIAGARARVAATAAAQVRAGGAGFDVRAYDAGEKAKTKAALEEEKKRKKALEPPKAGAAAKPPIESKNLIASITAGVTLGNVLSSIGKKVLEIGAAYGKQALMLALGYQGQARLSFITQKAQFDLRRLFQGTNPRPLLDAIQRTGQLLDRRTFAGATLSGLLQRAFEGFQRTLVRLEPVARIAFLVLLLGALKVENALLRLEIFGVRAGRAIEREWKRAGSGFEDLRSGAGELVNSIGEIRRATSDLSSAFTQAGTSGSSLGIVARVLGSAGIIVGAQLRLAASFLRNIATVFRGVSNVIAGIAAGDWSKAWTGIRQIVFGVISNIIDTLSGFGSIVGSQVDAIAKTFGVDLGLGKKFEEQKKQWKSLLAGGLGVPGEAIKPASKIGQDFAAGMAAGMRAGQAEVGKAGAELAKAAETGAKTQAEIKSPSARWRREIGRQMGAGARLGLVDSLGDLADAATIPGPGLAAGKAGGRTVGARNGPTLYIGQIGPFYGMPEGGEAQVRRWVFDAIDDAAERQGALEAA